MSKIYKMTPNLHTQIIRRLKPKFHILFKLMPAPRRILDIGIANNSYRECKAVFPNAIYHGLDYIDAEFRLNMGDQFILCNLEDPQALAGIEPIYDIVIANHVIEHLERGTEVFASLCSVLSPGGMLYVEVPSVRTAFHLKKPWRYHFNDDPTHRTFYRMEDLANLAMRSGCKVLSCGPCSTWLKDLLALPRAAVGLIQGHGCGPYLLHFQRKIDHILVQRVV